MSTTNQAINAIVTSSASSNVTDEYTRESVGFDPMEVLRLLSEINPLLSTLFLLWGYALYSACSKKDIKLWRRITWILLFVSSPFIFMFGFSAFAWAGSLFGLTFSAIPFLGIIAYFLIERSKKLAIFSIIVFVTLLVLLLLYPKSILNLV